MLPSETPSRPTFKVNHRGRDLWLSEGRFNIGRSILCNLVIDDVAASRHHAVLTVTDTSLTIEDLGSANGTFVNGERLGDRPLSLRVGDVVAIGAVQVVVGSGTPPAVLRSSEAPKPFDSQRLVAIPVESREIPAVEFPSGVNTERKDTFALLAAVADRAFETGKPGDAARVLEPHLDRVLGELRAGRMVSEAHQDWSIHYALRLAATLRLDRWIDYALTMLERSASPPRTDALVEVLEQALAAVDAVDGEMVRRYLELLRTMSTSFDVSAMQRAHRADMVLSLKARRSA